MATVKVSKASKWFSKSLRLSLHRLRSKSSSTLTSPGSSPSSPRTPNKRTKRPEVDEMKEVFRYFDGDEDGKISALELRAYFGSIGEYMSHEDAQEVINDLDSDGDSMLDYQDFLKLVQKEGCDDDLKKAFEMFELEKGSGCITPKGLQRMLNRLGDSKSYDECVAMIQENKVFLFSFSYKVTKMELEYENSTVRGTISTYNCHVAQVVRTPEDREFGCWIFPTLEP